MTTQPRRFGFKRWVVIALIVLGGYLAFGLSGIYKPVSPAVVLPPEPVWPGAYILPAIPGVLPEPTPFSNTFAAVLIADVVLIAAALGASAFARSGKLVPQGFYNFFEWLVEFLWNMTESAAGKWAKRMFPIMATIFLLVFTANMIKLAPGFESIGYMKQAHGAIQGYHPVKLFDLGGLSVYTIDGSKPVEHAEEAAHAEGEEAHAAEGEAGHGAEDTSAYDCSKEGAACEVVPSLRATATDLNFTFALAIVAFVMIQYFGFSALGLGYLGKFINVRTMISKPLFGVIDFGVGILELVSEFAKILSFGFRLFGNIFAGALLLAILGSLTAIIIPSALYGLEFFVGIIQAYVFSMLTLTFMSQAVVSHHGDEHEAEHAAEGAH
jgi:F-type H+-transporting ATPase subunit a